MADLTLLRTFVTVHRTGSITRAAKQLHMTQPAISQHVKALEAQLGQPLFVRTARGVTPTPYAKRLADDITVHVEALEAVSTTLRPDAATPTIHVGAPPDLLAVRALPALAPLVADGMRVVGVPGIAAELAQRLEAGELDVLVATERSSRGTIEHERAGEEPHVVIASPAWKERVTRKKAIRKDALAAAPFLAFREDAPIVRDTLARWEIDAAPRIALVVPDQRAIVGACEAGAGIAVVPRTLAEAALARGSIAVIDGPAEPAPQPIWIATREGRRRAPHVDRVVVTLLAALATAPIAKRAGRSQRA